jgi:hypothetical protein
MDQEAFGGRQGIAILGSEMRELAAAATAGCVVRVLGRGKRTMSSRAER